LMLGASESIIRLVLAAVLGGLVGLEREMHGRAAGFRTHSLVYVGATLVTLLSIYFGGIGRAVNADPARVAAGVVVGIGFLGAGTIIRSGGNVHGLTTAACLWVTAAMGMAVGSGDYLLAGVTTALVLVVLVVMRLFEQWVGRDIYRTISIETNRWKSTLEKLDEELPKRGMRILDRSLSVNKDGAGWITTQVRWRTKKIDADLVEQLREWEEISKVEWS